MLRDFPLKKFSRFGSAIPLIPALGGGQRQVLLCEFLDYSEMLSQAGLERWLRKACTECIQPVDGKVHIGLSHIGISHYRSCN